MKSLLPPLALIVLIACADSSTKWEKEPIEKILSQKTAEAKKKMTGPDTAYLGFVFGWSREDVSKHLEKLVFEDKIELDYDKAYKIKVPGMITTYEGTITAAYLNDSLVEVGANFETSESPIIAFTEFEKLIEKKYGPMGHIDRPVADLDYYNKYWFYGRLRIDLKMHTMGVRLNYVDTDKEAAYRAYLEAREKEKNDNVIDNF